MTAMSCLHQWHLWSFRCVWVCHNALPNHQTLNWKLLVFVTGLGLYEYMLLAEELNAEPIWVINNGLRSTFYVTFHNSKVCVRL